MKSRRPSQPLFGEDAEKYNTNSFFIEAVAPSTYDHMCVLLKSLWEWWMHSTAGGYYY